MHEIARYQRNSQLGEGVSLQGRSDLNGLSLLVLLATAAVAKAAAQFLRFSIDRI
jgi:hypothetical protein